MSVIIVHAPHLNSNQVQKIASAFGAQPNKVQNHYRLEAVNSVNHAELEALRADLALDINCLPDDFPAKQVRLLITDMDSTLINIECVDEIADFAGVKPQVSAITEAAMRGELDFAGSLKRRVALLDGLDASALDHVYHERLQLNPGAETLLQALKLRGVKTALVSGGFTFFTLRLQQRLGLDYTLANVLEVNEHKLTGAVQGDIVGAEAKAAFLQRICRQLAIDPSQAIAVGDGANDLKMLATAGLGVAYHAKDTVREQADVSIQYGGLDKVLDFIDA
jgi:phosphoserine phosphatase